MKEMERLLTVVKSRTVWTVIITFVINGIPAIQDMVPPTWLPWLNAVLGLATIYFRIIPRQEFK